MSDQSCGIVVDFDGTVADTFQPSPNSIGVGEAYARAIEEIFGAEGVRAYNVLNGLQNRAPGELMRLLLRQNPKLEKTVAAFFNAHDSKDHEKVIAAATEIIVSVKMKILTREVDMSWPLPCAGFQRLCETLLSLRQEGVSVCLAILSSGHTPFIRRVFETWGRQWEVCCPNVIISDDELRKLPIPPDQKVKPHPFLFDMMEAQLGFDREGMVYCGDDPNKDGRLAMASGVPFWLFDPTGVKPLPEGVRAAIRFQNWSVIADRLEANAAALRKGDLRSIR